MPQVPPRKEEPPVAPERDVRIFWSRAAEFRLANFVREEKDMVGNYKQREVSLEWHNHVLTTTDQAQIQYILGSEAYRRGDVKECLNLREAAEWTRKQDFQKRGNAKAEVAEVESTVIKAEQ